jgi:hypothetical protein
MSDTIETPPRMPLWARLVNIFATPGEVFESLKSRPPAAVNWLAPQMLGWLVTVAFCLMVFSQEQIIRSLRDAQEQGMQQQVRAGKMTQEQADQALATMDKFYGPKLMMVTGIVFGILGGLGYLFVSALVVWGLDALAFKSGLNYSRSLEIVGLAGMINVLGGIVKMLLVLVTGNLNVTAGAALLFEKFNPSNRLHALAGALDLMMIWHLAVLAIGLASITGVSARKAAAALFGIWAVIVVGIIGISSLFGWVH